ncbi:uncharacterized protein LOC125758345 [Rhipicephalus sanguineus]|uniref:uncharacterized protein LOC125758345 n=1 Tax=Rhipicephalus sanguineus TaxID=34632 RepID=UPI0020C262A9|nr:uncharacterized protein LOC125758345 [Rhipicephalus sanguineus]
MSDSSDSSSDSDVLPDFSFLESWDEEAEKEAGTGRTKRKRCPMGMWYYNLSERQRRAEDERIARELAHVEADFREVQKFEITAGLPESFCGAHLPRRVTFRLIDGSSSDDEGVSATRRSNHRILSSSDDDNAASAPRTLEGSVADNSTLNKDPSESSSGVVHLSKDRETSGALLYSILEEEAGGESDAGRASSSLTKADVLQRRRKRIEERQNLVEEMSSGNRSSSDKSTLKRSILQTFVITPKSRRISGRNSYVPRTLYAEAARATPSPKSSSEESSASLEQREPRPLFYLSSAASSFTDEQARSTSTPVGILYSTPRRVISLPDTSAAHAPHYPRGVLVTKAASAGRTQRAGHRRRREVLDRGETQVLAKTPEAGFAAAGSIFRGAQPPTKPPSAGLRPVPLVVTSDTRPPQASQTSVGSANRSTLIRIGIGDNRERVLSSDALSPSSAIVSFCSLSRSCTSEVAQHTRTDQAEETPAAHVDATPVDLIQQLLNICEQEAAVTFEVALRLTEDCHKCRKLGEGCTADVYLPQRPSGEESAVKVIPVGSERNVWGELPVPLASIIAEGVITRELSDLRFGQLNQSSSFIELKGMYFVQGTYHPVLAKSWAEYDVQWCSENPDPSNFEETQFYVLLDFENGGKTLERFKGTIEQLESVFLQVACSLAVAEPELEFEHRDLHCDNILMKRTEQDCVKFVLNGRKVLVRTAGVKASVIDYTLSRMRKGGNMSYTDVSGDTALFKGAGSYQYDVYRIMKDENGDDWEAYHPHTNVLWLSYVLQKLWNKLPRTKQAAKASTSRGRLAAWADAMLAPSAEAFVDEYVATQLQ